MAYRIERFHLTKDGLAVVIPHPQAVTRFAKQQGTIVLRFEPWTSKRFRDRIVAAMNEAQIRANEVSALDEVTP